jgi:hypothetical protein
MKKIFFLFILFFAGIMAHAQSTRVMESNLTLKKTGPTFYLQGSGANINFNNDLSLTQSSNRLTFSGGSLDLGSNPLFMTGGSIGAALGRVSSIFVTNINASLIESNVGTSVIGATGSRFLKGWFTDLEITNVPTINGVAMPVANWNTAYTDRLKWDGGNAGLVASDGRTSLGATTAGSSFFTLTNPSAITFPRINANNTVSALSASAFTTAIGAGHVYSDTMSVSAGVLRTKATTITTEPYSVQIFTSNGNDITHAVKDSVALNGGVYKLYVYSVDALTGAKIKIIY